MERHPAVVWTFLLGAGLALAFCIATSPAFPRPPQLIGCVFIHLVNVTCHWEPGDTPTTKYTLQVQRMSSYATATFTCTTRDTSCTLGLNNSTTRIEYCITITAHSGSQSFPSNRRCQPGRREVMLPSASLNSVTAVHGFPECLNVTWSRNSTEFPVSNSEIRAGDLNSQIEIKSQEQLDVQIRHVTVNSYTFLVCLLKPDTAYVIRLRHRYLGPSSPWSPWSKPHQGRTGEDAPSAAPVFWRQVKQTNSNGWRLVSLLWKPLPHILANGKVLFYNVTCQTKNAQLLRDHGNCNDLDHLSTSCSLHLPAAHCSCTLTASTSAGTSPTSRISLHGASETEPPSLSHVTASPLNDSCLEVRWRPLTDPFVTSYVVEWFAVREQNSSMLHWEKLNRFSKSLVITEGLKPMERYAISVRALYGEQGVGKNTTLYAYTRQGTPSVGLNIKVLQISGRTVELTWSPIPVELLHGFLCNYTLHYRTRDQPARSVFVPAHAHWYTLENLSPGNYAIFMQANTEAGAGAFGTVANVHIGSEEISTVMYVVIPLMLTILALMLMACLAQHRIVKEKLCQDVPDPSNSSLSHWVPKTTLESMNPLVLPEKPAVRYSEVIVLNELQNSNLDQDHSCQGICNLQTYSSLQSTLKVRISGKKLTRSSATELSPCSSSYSSVIISKPLQNPPEPLLHPSSHQYNCQDDTGGVTDVKLQLGGASEPSESHSKDKPKTSHLFLQQHQIPASFSDLSSVPRSSVLLSHTDEVSSLKLPFSQSSFNPLLQPNNFSHRSDSTSFSQFLPSVFVDLSYYPVECEPYLSL
ncbi:interleukin-6 receptor subunit beta-like [Archocentrus centrarchus]|uniref:interleukin-6 receptor subunit beta-like n=1 Tax=Archocentrus centrarchus TaxID=63155 RepID=UPI0011E9B60A|nr:interleukin-6 receptor subunit beta-like [Archocentrus centrarchus]